MSIGMLSRSRSFRGRPINAPASLIHSCQPIVASRPPSGQGWARELKQDGYRLQIHVRDGRLPKAAAEYCISQYFSAVCI